MNEKINKIIKEMFKNIRYTAGPVKVANKPVDLFVRKRLLHKGYSISTVDTIVEQIYVHVVYTDTLQQAETFINNEYGINIKL